MKYSIGYISDNEPAAIINDDILAGVSKKDWVKTVKNVIKTKFSNGVTIDRRLININAKTRNEFANSDYTNKIKYKKSVAPKDFKNDVFRYGADTFC